MSDNSAPFVSVSARGFSLSSWRTYLAAAAFVAAGLVLPQLCHLLPRGGIIFLPIYFFTLLASCRCGACVGAICAIAIPLLNCLLFGMPRVEALPSILVKGLLLAFLASWVAGRGASVSFLSLVFVSFAYQFLGGFFEALLGAPLSVLVANLVASSGGLLLQSLLAYVFLRFSGGWR